MSKNVDQDVAFIRALAEIMTELDLGEIEVAREYGENDELSIRLAKGVSAAPATMVAPAPAPAMPAPPAPAEAAAPAPATSEAPAESEATVTSPMVGTAYLSPEPGAAPFVEVGTRVTEGQTILIIEAMKTMNQIPAPHSGVVTSIFVKNAEPVEFGAPLMTIE